MTRVNRIKPVLAATALVLALYVVLRPENYSLAPNPIDPLYYSGYAINLDSMLTAAGLGRYFVTRWTMYLPAHFLSLVFGPFGGRLVLRLVLAVGIVLALWRFGRRWSWSRAQRVVAAVVLLTMPMFVRAFFTDYFEYAVVAYGLLLVMVSLRVRQTAWSASAMGVLLAWVMIANPFSVVMAAAPICTALWFGTSTWRERWRTAMWVVGSFAAVVLFGLLYFRWGYGLDNIYRPTFEFLGNAPPDPLSSPRRAWLGYFTWIYGPPIVAIVYVAIVRLRRATLDRTERLLLGMLAFQYLAHAIDQATRGDGLEISYYWSGIYPVFGMLLVVGITRAVRGAPTSALYGIVVGWLALLAVGVPHQLRLPSGAWLVLVAGAVVAAAIVVARRSVLVAAVVVLALIGWTHLGAPEYITPPGEANTSPRYDLLYRNEPYPGEEFYDAGVWFVEQMQRVPDDADAWFVSGDVLAGLFFYFYGVAVSHRGIGGDEPIARAAATILADPRQDPDGPLTVAFFGAPGDVDEVAARWSDALSGGRLALDAVRGSSPDLRLVVLVWDDAQVLRDVA